MEEKRSSFVDEFFPKSEAALPAESDILSSIFPPRSSKVTKSVVKDTSYYYEASEAVYGTEQTSDFQNRVSGGSLSERNDLPKKNNGSSVILSEIAEPCFMSSCVRYSDQDDFIPENSLPRYSGCSYNCKAEDDFDNSDIATRGEWWQGSFYY